MQQGTLSKTIYFSQMLNDELKLIQMWLDVNNLSLNVKKSKYEIFHHH